MPRLGDSPRSGSVWLRTPSLAHNSRTDPLAPRAPTARSVHGKPLQASSLREGAHPSTCRTLRIRQHAHPPMGRSLSLTRSVEEVLRLGRRPKPCSPAWQCQEWHPSGRPGLLTRLYPRFWPCQVHCYIFLRLFARHHQCRPARHQAAGDQASDDRLPRGSGHPTSDLSYCGNGTWHKFAAHQAFCQVADSLRAWPLVLVAASTRKAPTLPLPEREFKNPSPWQLTLAHISGKG